MGPFILDLHSYELDQEERELLAHPTVGGVIFFARNYYDSAQLSALVKAIRGVNPSLLLTVDQEGGRVQRFREGFFALPAPGLLAQQTSPDRLALIEDTGWLMAAELVAHDIDLSFAPVLDLERGSEVIGDRSFGDDPDAVIANASAYIKGMGDAGMAAVAKHFPGHGSVRADSHIASPVDERKYEAVASADLIPFKALINQGLVQGIMPAHVIYAAVDSQPAGFSRLWLQKILRQQLNFNGLIFSDDLSMAGAAIAGSYAQRAQSALAAGCDLLLACNNRAGAIEIVDTLSHDERRDLSSLKKTVSCDKAEFYKSERWKAASERVRRISE